VLVDHGDGDDHWTTVGAAPNIVEASVIALVDGIEHGLWRARMRTEREQPMKGEPNEGQDRLLAG
jgi:hypothetical protein